MRTMSLFLTPILALALIGKLSAQSSDYLGQFLHSLEQSRARSVTPRTSAPGSLKAQDTMTAEEITKSGSDYWTPDQKAAILGWVSRLCHIAYAAGLKAGQLEPVNQVRPSQLPTNGTTWVDSIDSTGEVLVLGDGTVWKIDTLDSLKTSLWIPPQRILVAQFGGTAKLVNLDRKDVVSAEPVK